MPGIQKPQTLHPTQAASAEQARFQTCRWRALCLGLSILPALFGTVVSGALGQSTLYWIEENERIQRVSTDGSPVEDVVTVRLDEPAAMAIDPSNDRLFWAATGEVGSTTLDGSNVNQIVSLASEGAFTSRSTAVAVDPEAKTVYWVSDDAIHRSNLDGSDPQDVITSEVRETLGLAVDPFGSKIYWTNSEFSGGVVRRANLDGTEIEDIVTDGLYSPQKIRVDPDGGKLYWTDLIANAVFRSNLDGTSVEEILDDEENPDGLALDLQGAKVYWTDLTEDAVFRANLDGTEREELTIEVIGPTDVSVDPASSSLYTLSEEGELYRSSLDGTEAELLVAPISDFEALAIDRNSAKLVWTSDERVQLSNLDGSNIEDLAVGGRGTDVEVDGETGSVYWTEFNSIWRADLDGSGAEMVVEADGPYNLTLDPQRGRMYWTGDGNITTADKIRWANLDGSESDILIQDLDDANRLRIDPESGFLFWTEGGFSFADVVRRSNTDGSALTDILDDQISGALAIDTQADKVYWSDRGIKRANFDGSGVEDLYDASFTVSSLTIDPVEGKMYWATEDRIEAANLDGSEVQILATGLERPEGLAVAPATPTSIHAEELPGRDFEIGKPYPNPFSESTRFTLATERPQEVRITVHNSLGQRVGSLYSGWLTAGSSHEFVFDPGQLPSGWYFCRIQGETISKTVPALLVR
jgi:low density lipoprotein receptor-related protein 5/6